MSCFIFEVNEICYMNKYLNPFRLLDGSPMRVFLESNNGPSSSGGTTLKSAAGASIKLPKASSTVKIQPDISAIHKVLFNPSSSSATRGLFKGGQGQ